MAITRKMVWKGVQGFFCLCVGCEYGGFRDGTSFDSKEFIDVFSDDLPGLSPDKEIEFYIDLVSGTKPILMAPYKIVPGELKKLNEHIQDFLDKVVIRTNVSLWGAPVLFVKKNDGSIEMCIDYIGS